MRKYPALCAALLLMACGETPTQPKPQLSMATTEQSRTVVVGHGIPSVDVAAVQHAVDNYAKVRLEGTFDFGEGGSVLITKAVELAGVMEESDYHSRNPQWSTTILGGGSGCDAGCAGAITVVNGTGGKVTIKEINFEGATLAAIAYMKGQELDIGRVRIADVSPALNPLGWENYRFGIMAGALANPFDIGGTIRIHDSRLEMTGMSQASSRPIFVGFDMAHVVIADNDIRDPHSDAAVPIETLEASRSIRITGNNMAAGGACIAALASYGPVHIADNTCESSRSGMILTSRSDEGDVVANNDIHVSGGYGIRVGWVYWGGQMLRNAAIRNNRITGTVWGYPGIFVFRGHGNVFEGNDIDVVNLNDGSPAYAYGLATETRDNVVRLRKHDLYYDEGTNNQIEWPGRH
jgi:hypothetical protein